MIDVGDECVVKVWCCIFVFGIVWCVVDVDCECWGVVLYWIEVGVGWYDCV